jgi:NADH-quinone oxidoreductase subunit L
VAIAWRVYGGTRGLEGGAAWAKRFPRLHRLLENKYWVDEAYDATVVRGTWGLAHGCRRFDARVIDGFGVHGVRNLTLAASYISGFFDKYVVDGLVNLVAVVLQGLSRLFRRLQGGLVSQYALVMVVGVFTLAFFCVLLLTR